MKDPVAKAEKAFYGFKKAGDDCGERFKCVFVGLGYRQIRDVATSVFIRRPILLIVYSDDLRINGPKQAAWAAYNELDGTLQSSKKGTPFDTKYVGIVRDPLGTDKYGAAWYRLQQSE